MGRYHHLGPQNMKISRDGKLEKNTYFSDRVSDFLCPFVVRRVHMHTTLNNIISQGSHSGNAFLQKAGSSSFRRLRSCLQQPFQCRIFCVKQEMVEAGRGAPAPSHVPGRVLSAGAPGRTHVLHATCLAPALPTATLCRG